MEPEYKGGDRVLVSILNFNNLKGQKEMRDSFVGPFTIIKLIGKNAVDVRLTEEFSRKHPVFPVSLIKITSRMERTSSPPGKRPTPHRKYWRWKTPLAM
ncbi:hypothetical protein O181_000784 [Austropuccinia psidii MF-1]|uniref:Tf2-1-like SH3-like domain-containing protein n=1 Tax=Austropuccinia psidii MF-1 TaxID=1389203 RepID=A0A9Q3B989_9BASI|nr:hypothetical protein [Austropuccinia psidii MF-1]